MHKRNNSLENYLQDRIPVSLNSDIADRTEYREERVAG